MGIETEGTGAQSASSGQRHTPQALAERATTMSSRSPTSSQIERPAPQPQASTATLPQLFATGRALGGRAWRSARRWFAANTFTPTWAPPRLRAPYMGYLIAVLAQIVATSFVVLLLAHFNTFAVPGVPQILAIALIALNWGAGPSVVSTLCGAALVYFAILPPRFALTPFDARSLAEACVFLTTGLVVSVVASQTERMRLANGALATRLAAEQTRLEAILEAAPEMISIHDASGAIVRRNRAAKLAAPEVRGDERIEEAQEAYGLHDLDGHALPADELPVARALRGQTITNLELLSRLSDGEHIFAVSAAPYRDAWGTILGAVAITHDITPLRRSEQAAAERAAQLEATFDSLVDGVVVFDPDANLLQMNNVARRLIGLSESQDFIGQSVDERMARLRLEDVLGKAIPRDALPQRRVLRGEVFFGLEADDYLIHTLDGRELRVNIGGGPVRDDHGAIIGGVITFRDVGEQRRLKYEVTERAAQIAATYDTMTDGVVVYGDDGHISSMNAEARDIFGRGIGAARADVPLSERMLLLDLLDEQGHPIPHDAWPTERILAGETLRGADPFDVSFVALDGRRVWLTITGAPVRDAEGRIIGGVVIYRDVTERRRLENRTHDALVALLTVATTLVDPTSSGTEEGARIIAQRLIDLTRSVLDCTRVVISVLDPATDVMRALAVTGLSPAHQRQWWAEQHALEASGTRFSKGPNLEVATRLRAGEVLTFDLTQPPYDATPNPYGVRNVLIAPMCLGDSLVGTITYDYGGADHIYTQAELLLAGGVARLAALVLERERLLRESADDRVRVLALERANARMDEFLGVASHELKTPLTTIKANIQLTERRLNALDPSAANFGDQVRKLSAASELMERTQRQVSRLDRLVNDLLDVSRIRAGKLDLRLEVADLNEIVREVVREQRTAWSGRPIELTLPVGAVPVHADADRIGQVVTNYLTNALKYSAEEEPVVVTLDLATPGFARVTVRDRGPGLPPDQQESIWERFHRAPGVEVLSGSGVGLGLGLHISREIVERHGGAVGLESVVGEGSTFSFTLPRADI